ncbi:hypothetical protein R1flu_020208 [Riccia fluitans]|uniref:CUE domain-containing protein n=1 Tax=Riccia fluitans TaxID=41844 RepID=A0ABD1ZKV1_9MARC
MAWRASYRVLLEIFPQVDSRLIKGAALSHGEDLSSALDFILNEVLAPADDTLHQEDQTVSATERRASEFLSTEQNSGETPAPRNISDGDDSITISKVSKNEDTKFLTYCKDEAVGGPETIAYLTASPSNTGSNEGTSKEEERAVISNGMTEDTCASISSCPLDGKEFVAASHLLSVSRERTEHVPRTNLVAYSIEEVEHSDNEPFSDGSVKSYTEDVEITRDEREDLEGPSQAVEKGDSIGYSEETVCVETGFSDAGNSRMEESDVVESEELDLERGRDSAYISVSVETKMSFDEDETEGGCWETISSTSVQMASMETLLEAVEQAQADKDVLISSIEELRALRQKTDEEEYAARVARDEAQKGGQDVMAQVAEMRQMLSLAREANQVRAAEVHGEKAVLATEARELQSRLVQLKTDKERALSVLNEIKASLKARINKACQEREFAMAEKGAKEALARECLIQEEASMAKVALESRELQAESETCNLLREFLIERGNIVDALQGEVAVLCEDAEELKEEIERMSLSCSSGFVHMLKPALLGDSHNGSFSRSSKSVFSGGGVTHCLESKDEVDIPFDGDVSAISPARSLAAGQRSVGDKRLPSLRRALSGSQDLSGSSHSSVNSTSVASMPSVTKVVTDVADGNGNPEEEFSSPHASQSGSEAERKLYQAQMAMFPDESDLIDFRTSNLDIFRVESSRPAKEQRGTSSDEDDWHLLDLAVGQTRSTSESSCSSYVGK